jgi:hypothetical protein
MGEAKHKSLELMTWLLNSLGDDFPSILETVIRLPEIENLQEYPDFQKFSRQLRQYREICPIPRTVNLLCEMLKHESKQVIVFWDFCLTFFFLRFDFLRLTNSSAFVRRSENSYSKPN